MPEKVTKEEKAQQLLHEAIDKAKAIIQEANVNNMELDEKAEGDTVKVKDAKAKKDTTKPVTDPDDSYAGEVNEG